MSKPSVCIKGDKIVNIKAEKEDKDIKNFVSAYNSAILYMCKKYNAIYSTIKYDDVKSLIKIPYISFNILWNIKKQLSCSGDNTLRISNLCKRPDYFLNSKYNLITIKAYQEIIKYNPVLNKDEDVMNGLSIAFIFHYFKTVQQEYFIPKFKSVANGTERYYTLKRLGVKLIPKSKNWFYYNELEYKYTEFKQDWNISDWNPKDLDLKEYKDDYAEAREKGEKDPLYWKVIRGEYYTTQVFLDMESDIDDRISNFGEIYDDIDFETIDKYICQYEKDMEQTLNKKQKLAVRTSFDTNLFCLSGYPGTGKSTVVEAIMYVKNKYYHTDLHWICCSPTNLALNGLKNKLQKGGFNCRYSSLHKFIYNDYPNYKKAKGRLDRVYYPKYKKAKGRLDRVRNNYRKVTNDYRENMDNENKGLQEFIIMMESYDTIIIDEASMIDLEMFNKILQCAEDLNLEMILIGDNEELPPIGVGRPFKRICEALDNEIIVGKITYLKTIMRNEGILSRYIINLVTNRRLPPIEKFDRENLIYIPITGSFEKTLLSTIQTYDLKVGHGCSIITARNGKEDYTYDGSVNHINDILQKKYKKSNIETIKKFNKEFNKNDIVLRIKNDYSNGGDIGRANGEMGIISSIEIIDGKTTINIVYRDDGKMQTVTEDDLFEEFKLAYGMTVHKKQGGEDDTIIVVISPNHSDSWNSTKNEFAFNLLYTAISRAKKRCIIIGDESTYNNIFIDPKRNVSTFYSTFLQLQP